MKSSGIVFVFPLVFALLCAGENAPGASAKLPDPAFEDAAASPRLSFGDLPPLESAADVAPRRLGRGANGGFQCATCVILLGLVQRWSVVNNATVEANLAKFCHIVPGKVRTGLSRFVATQRGFCVRRSVGQSVVRLSDLVRIVDTRVLEAEAEPPGSGTF